MAPVLAFVPVSMPSRLCGFGCLLRVARRVALPALPALFLLVALCGPVAGGEGPAGERPSENEPWRIALEAAGVTAQLSHVARTVSEEAAEARAACPASGRAPNGFALFEAGAISRALAPDALTAHAVAALRARLDRSDLVAALDWYGSAAGRRVVAAERASAGFDEAYLEGALGTLPTDPSWTPARRARLRAVLEATRTGEFVAALDGALTALVALVGSCADAATTLARLEGEARGARSGEPLVAMLMRIELLPSSGVVLREVDAGTLDALVAFARSPAGGRWHEALVVATRESLARARHALAAPLRDRVVTVIPVPPGAAGM